MEVNLLDFLLDDVTALLNNIKEREDMQGIAINNANFDTLREFESYWSKHLHKLKQ